MERSRSLPHVVIQDTEEPGRGPEIERQSGSRFWILSLTAGSPSKDSATEDCEWILGKEGGFGILGSALAEGMTKLEGQRYTRQTRNMCWQRYLPNQPESSGLWTVIDQNINTSNPFDMSPEERHGSAERQNGTQEREL